MCIRDSSTGARAATGYALYHPAAALRQRSLKETMQRDMAAVPEVLIRARAERESTADPTTTASTEAPSTPDTPKDEPMTPTEDQYGLF